MICSEFMQLLDSYETLDENQRMSLELHSAQCEACHKELEFFKSIIKTSATIPCPKPPKTLISDINAALDSEPVVTGMFIKLRENIRNYATVAACLVVGIVVGINGGYIKERLSDNSTEGVIKETVVAETDSATDNAVKANQTDVPKAETNAEKTVKPETTDEKPASSVAKGNKATTNTQKPQTAVQTQVPATVKPLQTVSPRTEQDNSKTDRYVISQGNYYLPDNEGSDVAEPVTTPNVNEYSIADKGSEVAYYNFPLDGSSKSSSNDYLRVSGDDMGAVVSIMSELGVASEDGYYTTSRANFYRLIDRLDAQNIGYVYDLRSSSGDKVLFKLRYIAKS